MQYADLKSASDDVVQKYKGLSNRTKANSTWMKDTFELQKHIGTYSKTREVYAQYRRLLSKKKEQFYAEHIGEIISCEAAKRVIILWEGKRLHENGRTPVEWYVLDS